MLGGFRSSEVFKGTKIDLSRYWLRILAALVIALTFGNAGQTPPAQAASPDSTDINFELNVYPEKLPTLCPKEQKMLYVSVSKTVYKVINDKTFELHGSSFAPAIDGKVTAGTGTLTKMLGDIDYPGQTPILFTAGKPGVTTLKFTVSINNSWIGTNEKVTGSSSILTKEVRVKVIPCKFKVVTTSQWSANYPNYANKLVANLKGEMEVSANGQYAGTASVTWSMASFSWGCSHHDTISPGQAQLTGNLSDDGSLWVTVTYDLVAITDVSCGASGSWQIQGPPIEIAVPASGGTLTQPQTFQVAALAFSGSAVIVVIPEEDQAVAFNPNNHEASWDDFSSLFGILLALR